MKIKGKLQRLLLISSLSPLLLSSGIFLLLLLGLGDHFASDTKDFLVEQSNEHLQSLIRNFELVAQKNFQLAEWVVVSQLHAIDRTLNEGEKIDFSQVNQENNSSIKPVKKLLDVKLEALSDAFLQLREKSSNLILRQYVTFNSGRSYYLPPGQLKLTPVKLSDQEWLENAYQKSTAVRSLVKETQKHSLTLAIGSPLQNSSETTVGSAVVVSLDDLIPPLKLPASWQVEARVLLVSLGGNAEGLSIVAEASRDGSWRPPSETSPFDSDFLAGTPDFVADVLNDRPGTLVIDHHGNSWHWAYGTPMWGEVFPLVILEHDQIVSYAILSEQHILGKIKLGATMVGIVLLVFIGLSVFTAGRLSQTVTEPARKLSSAFNQLARGDYNAQVNIKTGDEFEELSENFNGLGAKLEDRNRMAISLALAREVQQHLLPERPPLISGMDLFSCGIPCDEIGGDYYDFISQEDKNKAQIGIAVGDVTGHGVPAALLMASARGVLRTHARCHGGDLAILFQLLNHHLTKDSDHDHFMTLFYGILDREKGTLCWNSAGHGPVLLYQSQSNSLKELGTTGPPLGIDEKFSYRPQTLGKLETGDILLAGTDGLWECRNQSGVSWGVEMLKNKLLQVTTMSASDIGQFLLTELAEFRSGHRQEDDISLIIAKLT